MTVTTFPAPSRAADSAGIVARNLRALMADRGVPQRRVAEVLGVTQSNVSKRLKGRTPFTTDDLDALALAFGVRPSDLLADAGQNAEARTPEEVRAASELPRLDSNQQPAGQGISLVSARVAAEILPLAKPLAPVIPLPVCARTRTGWPESSLVTDSDRAA